MHSMGITLSVSGVDRNWVSATYDTLATHLARNVPWWTYLRTTRVIVALALTLAVVVYQVLTEDQPLDVVSLLYGTIAFGYGFTILLGYVVRRWLIPQLEVIEAGSKPILWRFIAFLVALAGLVLGVAGLLVATR